MGKRKKLSPIPERSAKGDNKKNVNLDDKAEEDILLHQVKLRPYNKRLRNPVLVEAIDSIPPGSTEMIYQQGLWHFDRKKYRFAFVHFDICVLKRHKESLFRLARASAAYHLQLYKLTLTDSAYALQLKEDEERSENADGMHRELSPVLRLRIYTEAQRNKARCAYWQGKAQYARGMYAEARAAFARSDQLFTSKMARRYLAEIPRSAEHPQDVGTRQQQLAEKRLFLDVEEDGAHLLRDILTHPFESRQSCSLTSHEQDFIFERASYEKLLCDVIYEHYSQ